MVKVEVDDGLNVHGHVNLNDGRQGQGPGRRPPDAGAAEARPQPQPFDRHLSSGRRRFATAALGASLCRLRCG
jgi:hypothetical protein